MPPPNECCNGADASALCTARSAPSLVLLECRRGGKPGLSVEPPLLLRLEDGGESHDVRRAYFRDKE
mgnify:CR=1 FL=1